jgi:phage tail-like protein
MTTNFQDLLYAYIPGVYRDKDELGELRRFLEIFARQMEELETNIGQLYEDFYVTSCRELFVGLIGNLLGIEIDRTMPVRAQRAEVEEALASYRQKGLRDPLSRFAEQITGWPVTVVDFSQTLALSSFVTDLSPIVTFRKASVAERPTGSGNFFFSKEANIASLYDSKFGRPILRSDLDGHESEYAGVESRFSIEEFGVSLFAGSPPRFAAIAANLANFARPEKPDGGVLTIPPNHVAIDPELGRFKILSPIPLAGNLTVDFHLLISSSISQTVFDIRDPLRPVRLGRSDDPVPYTLDVRSPTHASDRTGRQHFDNHGFFITFGRKLHNQKPNVLPPNSQTGRFSFDSSPIGIGDKEGIPIQLMDGTDGAALTRHKFAGHELEYCGTPRGFSIRLSGIDLTDQSFPVKVTIRAANLSDFDHPRDVDGNDIVPRPADILIDPQLGRFLMDLSALHVRPADVRADYLLAPVQSIAKGKAFGLSSAIPEVFAFARGGEFVRLRDAVDGTPLSSKVRLGVSLASFHGTSRGWTIRRNGVNVRDALQAQAKSLENLAVSVPPNHVAIDLDRGRFKFPAGFLNPDDVVTVDFSFENQEEEQLLLDSVAQRLPRMLPAGTNPVLIDTRRTMVDPKVLE